MDIKEQRQLLRDMDRRIISMLQARLDLVRELDAAIDKELGIDPFSTADTDISILTAHMRSLGFDSDMANHVADFLIHYVR